MSLYKYLEKLGAEVLHGGKADGMPDQIFNKKELKKGMKHESEHTKNKKIQKEIAKDHIVEDPHYYEHIAKVEKVAGIKKTAGPINRALKKAFTDTNLYKSTRAANVKGLLAERAARKSLKQYRSNLPKDSPHLGALRVRAAESLHKLHGLNQADALDEANSMSQTDIYKLLGMGSKGSRKAQDAWTGTVGTGSIKKVAGFLTGFDKVAKELTTKGRKHIKEENFALPGRRYPIHDESHARNALARVSQHGTPDEQSKVKAAVHKKFPGIGEK